MFDDLPGSLIFVICLVSVPAAMMAVFVPIRILAWVYDHFQNSKASAEKGMEGSNLPDKRRLVKEMRDALQEVIDNNPLNDLSLKSVEKWRKQVRTVLKRGHKDWSKWQEIDNIIARGLEGKFVSQRPVDCVEEAVEELKMIKLLFREQDVRVIRY